MFGDDQPNTRQEELSIKSARIRELECQLEHHRELHRQLFVKLATAEEALRDLKKEDRT